MEIYENISKSRCIFVQGKQVKMGNGKIKVVLKKVLKQGFTTYNFTSPQQVKAFFIKYPTFEKRLVDIIG